MKIGVYDSGLGGLTIFKEAIKNVAADYIYLGDNKNAPYGVKKKKIVKEYIFNNVEYLINQGCKIIVIACNTATSIAIKVLRQKYQDICFIGTEPAVKKAVDSNDYKKILVCGTSLTIKEEKLNNLIHDLHANEKVELLSLDKLVDFAESEKVNFNNNTLNLEVIKYLKESFKDYKIEDYSYLVLGCTHFPLFKNEFKDVLGTNINIIDGSVGVVNNLKNKVLTLNKNNQNTCKIKLVITKDSKFFINKFKTITCVNNFEVKVFDK